jgi:hypothetical protein
MNALLRNRDEGIALLWCIAGVPLSLWGRGREAMTYGCVRFAERACTLDGATVSHSAELVRGHSRL